MPLTLLLSEFPHFSSFRIPSHSLLRISYHSLSSHSSHNFLTRFFIQISSYPTSVRITSHTSLLEFPHILFLRVLYPLAHSEIPLTFLLLVFPITLLSEFSLTNLHSKFPLNLLLSEFPLTLLHSKFPLNFLLSEFPLNLLPSEFPHSPSFRIPSHPLSLKILSHLSSLRIPSHLLSEFPHTFSHSDSLLPYCAAVLSTLPLSEFTLILLLSEFLVTFLHSEFPCILLLSEIPYPSLAQHSLS